MKLKRILVRRHMLRNTLLIRAFVVIKQLFVTRYEDVF